jgi:hypothetical protein
MTNEITEQEWVSLLQRIYTSDSNNRVSSTKVTLKKSNFVNDDSIIAIPLDKLKELHDNLIFNGFTDTEALVITAQVAANARTTI